jgi:hypothetical protein
MEPLPPRLTPVMRAGVLIPYAELVGQLTDMDRFGTWCLAQVYAEYDLIRQHPASDDRYHNARMDRMLKLAGASLGSINARVALFKFLQEDPSEFPGGDPEKYQRARRRGA